MIPDRPLHLDDRWDIECLTHRGRIIWPDVILPDGTASPSQLAIIPPGVLLARACLPHRELSGPVSTWTGAALVGTREPSLVPYLPEHELTAALLAEHDPILRPQGSHAILRWIYDLTGYRYAPAAFLRVAGFEMIGAATWLDHLYGSGAKAELIVAERQAAAAVRAMFHYRRGAAGGAMLIAASGAPLAARALVDMVRTFERVIHDPRHRIGAAASTLPTPADTALRYAMQRLRAFVNGLDTLAAMRDPDEVRGKFIKLVEHGRFLVEAIALFTVGHEPLTSRVERVTDRLRQAGRPAPALAGGFDQAIAAISVQVEQIAGQAGTSSQLPSGWDALLTGDLARLTLPDGDQRVRDLATIRTDLIYKLIVTRRLDHLFRVLPWMAAPSGAFPGHFGGPLGGIAALFEAGRKREVALELARRTVDVTGGPRLSRSQGKKIYSKPQLVTVALNMPTPAGFLLASSALSHHMVIAMLAGRPFAPAHPLPTLKAGGLAWDFKLALGDHATMATVSSTEIAKPIYASHDYVRDLPRYMGEGIVDTLASPLVDAFPKNLLARNPIRIVIARRTAARQRVPNTATSQNDANRALLRSALKSINAAPVGPDAEWRTDDTITAGAGDVELAAFDRINKGHVAPGATTGEAIRKRASKLRRKRGSPQLIFQQLIDRARGWDLGSDDRPIMALLTGRHDLNRLTPVAQTSVPALWFRPAIDSHIHGWIAAGSPQWTPVAIWNVKHAGLIAHQVEAVTKAMPKLFGMTISPALRERILVPLWTGLAGITADHAHVR